ncbi:hypothetical protein [Parasitella parasitica]|uniref:Phosphatidate phosphatase APP1 catalytic domain-containing protein n=1 Tax=Parasitella parasitica TaxID=35722 RepID=A0A0B7NFJ3_9FUNG|nr:hypothetical protein [Parasitella parasitica]
MNRVRSVDEPRVRRRDQLISFVSSKSQALKQYYATQSSHFASPSITERNISDTGFKRSDTQEIDDILTASTPEVVQPQCMLFPTYACPIYEKDQEIRYKIVLAGWAFAKPNSSRLDRWLLAAGRTYGGLARDSVEDNHFATLLNQFRCQTMRMVDIQLTLPGIVAQKIIDDNEDHISVESQEKIRDYAASVNTGPSGRFQKEVYLNLDEIMALEEKQNHLTVQASFAKNEPSFPGYIDIIGQHGISIISDIDDTIKITNILDGKDAILQNTFFKTAIEVPHMSEVFRLWVYPALSEFISNKKFPQGSMHLRAVSAQELIRGKPGKHKLETIPKILQDFPHRKFILIGDSGEIDPEVYQQIYNKYPNQIIKIFIHDVTSERAKNADRIVQEKPDSYYKILRKFLSRESSLLRRGSTSQLAMDAMAETEVPEEQQQISNPDISLLTKLEQFENRMQRVSSGMREGVFTVFTLASQLMLDPVVAEEFLMSKTTDLSI